MPSLSHAKELHELHGSVQYTSGCCFGS